MSVTSDSYQDIIEHLPQLEKAWESISSEPFNPDLNSIKFLIEHGIAFFKSSEVGFYGFVMGTHLFTSVSRADVVTIYIYPKYRNTIKAYRLLRQLFRHAKSVGAKEIYFSVPYDRQEELFSWTDHYESIDLVLRRNL